MSNGSQGVFYTSTLMAVGGLGTYSWALTQGSLPEGVTLNATTGVISGTPSVAGSSSFTIQVSDAEVPSATAATSLSMNVNSAPARGAALYTPGGNLDVIALNNLAFQIKSDGSLTPLPSSPEPVSPGTVSPNLPLMFVAMGHGLQSVLVNPDYSLTPYGSITLPSAPGSPVVDPTGSNLYVTGAIDTSGTSGINILPANGLLQVQTTMAVPNVSGITFTPNASLALVSTCTSSGGTVISFSRNSDGTLKQLATYTLPSNNCILVMHVSPDGNSVAAIYGPSPGAAATQIEIYSIAQDGSGTLAPVLSQPYSFFSLEFQVDLNLKDVIWDSSGSYLVASTYYSPVPIEVSGGLGVLRFSGNDLTETTPPTGNPTGALARTGSFIYVVEQCFRFPCFTPMDGYLLQNGLLTPLPGSPYGNANSGILQIY